MLSFVINTNIWSRSFREGWLQFWRHRFLSFTTFLLGALIVFLLNLVFAVQFWADFSLEKLESRADFSVPLVGDSVNNYSFMLGALEADVRNNFSVDLQILAGDGALPDRMHIVFSDLSEVGGVLDLLKKPAHVDIIGNWDMTGEAEFVYLTERLLALRDGLDWVSLILVVLFFIGGVLLMINTFRLLLFARRDEISVARLVGADARFILGPFLMEGVLLGLLAALMAVLLTVLLLVQLGGDWGGRLFLFFWDQVFSWEILICAGVGALGAWVSLRRYLWGKFDLFD